MSKRSIPSLLLVWVLLQCIVHQVEPMTNALDIISFNRYLRKTGGSSGGSRRKRVKPSKVIRVVEETPDIEDEDEDDLERKRHLDR